MHEKEERDTGFLEKTLQAKMKIRAEK